MATPFEKTPLYYMQIPIPAERLVSRKDIPDVAI
jgi:hypothetical protein